MKRNVYTNEPCQPWELWGAECDTRPITTAEQVVMILQLMAFSCAVALLIGLAIA